MSETNTEIEASATAGTERTRVRESPPAAARTSERSERATESTVETNERTTRTEERCPECDGPLDVDEARGETTCRECGLVVTSDRIDRGPEWRSYGDDAGPSKSRVGPPMTKMMHDKGLSTTIGWQNRDSYGKTLDPRQRAQMQRLRTWDERFRTRDHDDRNLKQALGEIDRMGSALGLPETVRETASVVYRRALEADLLPGRSIEAIATAAIYAAARQGGSPRSIDEVATVSRVDRQEFLRAYRYVVRELGLGVDLATPDQYLTRYASALDLDGDTEQTARELIDAAEAVGATSGKNPISVAAGAIYAASQITGLGLTQDEVGEAASVSTVTIRNRYQELLEIYGEADA